MYYLSPNDRIAGSKIKFVNENNFTRKQPHVLNKPRNREQVPPILMQGKYVCSFHTSVFPQLYQHETAKIRCKTTFFSKLFHSIVITGNYMLSIKLKLEQARNIQSRTRIIKATSVRINESSPTSRPEPRKLSKLTFDCIHLNRNLRFIFLPYQVYPLIIPHEF